MLEKAASLPADEVFLDLEDAVAPSEKTDETRERIVQALMSPDWQAPTRTVRVNAVGTPWCLADITYVVGRAGADLHAVMLPKVESVAQVHFVDYLLHHLELSAQLPRRIGLEVQIESPRGLMCIEQIACASSRIEALIFGPGDYAASVGAPQLTVGAIDDRYPGDQWHYVLSRILTTARALGLQAIDGPYSSIRDREGFAAVAARASALGFDGKWAIHPDQIDACNEAFTPSAEQFSRALSILESYERATKDDLLGAAVFESEMIDEASRKMAEMVVARGRAAGIKPEALRGRESA